MAKTFGVILGLGKGGSFDRTVRKAMPSDPMIRDLLMSLLETLAILRERRRRFDRQLGRIAREDETCRRLMTAPGIGPVTAVAFAAAIEDPSRFRRESDVGAYLGLTPTPYQSGEVDIGRRIARCGDRLTRRLLFEAANVILYRNGANSACELGPSDCRLDRAVGRREWRSHGSSRRSCFG